MQNILLQLEKHLLRGPRQTYRVLGVSYSNYMAMRSDSRPTPSYVEGHAEALMLLSADNLNKLVGKRLKNG